MTRAFLYLGLVFLELGTLVWVGWKIKTGFLVGDSFVVDGKRPHFGNVMLGVCLDDEAGFVCK